MLIELLKTETEVHWQSMSKAHYVILKTHVELYIYLLYVTLLAPSALCATPQNFADTALRYF